ncbi:hypothetical protein [Burkholderia pseudomallei]|uniref:hypothetical protein n=1 Tax=Burkholderia pseudomallei TaxID=28450 RepID=UPI000F2304E3|nr:hypothetical protein [Burkholderia pseudomallei]CAJ3078859.1 Uncharacterised protein [Burkholderia pseudomallei]VCK72343.1 Uncharacterised protein [Burkholderia pseudomallei]VCK79769.1 Uncharacterised protein [Burkholderia pseudomallei]VCK80236.1 Uncharacterised protein [Burkholderia pseudomallei]VCK80601.1 Uncharacterised protein [Burkholderia pseudomallei]
MNKMTAERPVFRAPPHARLTTLARWVAVALSATSLVALGGCESAPTLALSLAPQTKALDPTDALGTGHLAPLGFASGSPPVAMTAAADEGVLRWGDSWILDTQPVASATTAWGLPLANGQQLFEHPELMDSCATSPEAALRLATAARAQATALIAPIESLLGAAPFDFAAGDPDSVSVADADNAWPSTSEREGGGAAGGGASLSPVMADTNGPSPLATKRSATAGSMLNAAPVAYDRAPQDALSNAQSDGSSTLANALDDASADRPSAAVAGHAHRGRSGSDARSHASRSLVAQHAIGRPRSLLDEPAVRAATFWDVGGGLHPQVEQVGRALFLDPAQAWPAPAAYAGSEASRMGQLQRAIALHAQRKPQGWDVLVDAVRRAREEDGEVAALRLADALINQVPYVDGTDGTFYPPYRFFTEAHVVCKDYAVASYLLLLDSGYPAEKLRILALAPRFAAAPEWHIMTVALAEGYAEPFALSSNSPGSAPAAWHGPSPILRRIMSGDEPATSVFKGPHGPALQPLSASDQAHRPVAEAFTEHGFVSFELDSSRTASGGWTSIAGGDFPKWRLPAAGNTAYASLGSLARPTRTHGARRGFEAAGGGATAVAMASGSDH